MAQYAFSIAVNNLKKKYGMSDPAYLIYADLRAAGWSQTDAWNVAFQGKGLNWSKAELVKEMNKLETLNSVQNRIADLQGKAQQKDKDDDISPEELAKETSKETSTPRKRPSTARPTGLKSYSSKPTTTKLSRTKLTRRTMSYISICLSTTRQSAPSACFTKMDRPTKNNLQRPVPN